MSYQSSQSQAMPRIKPTSGMTERRILRAIARTVARLWSVSGPSRPDHERGGYTLIEMIAAMAAASLLMLGLAASVVISTSLVEPNDEDGHRIRDRVIVDRLQHDLRYATNIDSTSGYGISIERSDLANQPQSLQYDAYIDGLMRNVSGGTSIQLDPLAPTVSHYVDGHTAPTSNPDVWRPRIRDVSTAVTSGSSTSSLTIQIPDAARPGDLLLLVVSSRNAFFVNPSPGDWQYLDFAFNTGILLEVHGQWMNTSTPDNYLLNFFWDGDVVAAVLVIEHANGSWPFGWSGSSFGTSINGNTSTYPRPLENTDTIGERTLNLQLIASTGAPSPQTSLGIASFSECVNEVGSPGTSGECTLGIAFRTGPMPPLMTSPRVLHQQSANWTTIAIEVEGESE
ncbi:prepilin-type N-terminal cleavage/methylation domain-containing protein [Stieleria sp. ICT_E10.1]|uniref:prepilin-type N-terminal cleavage/methylation domain-containing protein n=1 Tax=Stieleria sedimenti TaxID=2976331 RepID=UPI00217FB559|nr:prepilin-type N-terminal cleavage/methylation domain-containing protein [Stieleria sedimenti]MCS7467566.1 prepilin-type N-terminal cleavage/methylation domain-containing protein [Stieleria sedimenti]